MSINHSVLTTRASHLLHFRSIFAPYHELTPRSQPTGQVLRMVRIALKVLSLLRARDGRRTLRADMSKGQVYGVGRSGRYQVRPSSSCPILRALRIM